MSDRDLANEIFDEITADIPDGYTDAALTLWNNYPDAPPRDRMARVLAFVAAVAISRVLERHGHTGSWYSAREAVE